MAERSLRAAEQKVEESLAHKIAEKQFERCLVLLIYLAFMKVR